MSWELITVGADSRAHRRATIIYKRSIAVINPVHGNNHRRSDMAWKDCFLLRLPKKMGASFFYGSSRPPHSWLSISPVGNEFANIFLFKKKKEGGVMEGQLPRLEDVEQIKIETRKKRWISSSLNHSDLLLFFYDFVFFFLFPPPSLYFCAHVVKCSALCIDEKSQE